MKKESVLIVEDDFIVAKVIEKNLIDFGYTVAGLVATGNEAIAKAGSEKPDLVLMDIHLQGDMDGIAASEKIRTAFNIPVVFLTALSDKKTFDQALVTAPYGYIIKPFSPDTLSATIRVALNKKQADQRIMDRHAWLDSTIRSLPEGIVIYGPDLTILYVNPATSKALGYSAETLIGTPVLSYIAEEYREEVAARMAASHTDNDIPLYETSLLTKDGLHRTVIVKGTPILYHNNPAFLTLLIDITERKKWEMKLESHAQELMQLSASLAMVNRKLNLLSSITRHDISNQLTVLQGYRALLEKKQTDPSFTGYFQKINDSAQRISSMIQFTKTYENIGVNAPAWQDTRTIIETAVKEGPPGQVMVKNDLPAGAEVYADPLIVKVFYNLIDNAVRYGEKITTIRFSVQESGDDHVIVCEDNGIGIPAGEKEKIFERGFGQNTGLGLFLAREILDITGITIKETGEPGKGARFEIMIPEGAWRTGKKGAQ